MKNILFLILFLPFFQSCTQTNNAFVILQKHQAIKIICEKAHSGYISTEQVFTIVYPLIKTPKENIFQKNEGIYIKISSFFVTEEGLFIPSQGFSPPNNTSDPSYKQLDECLYQYMIKG